MFLNEAERNIDNMAKIKIHNPNGTYTHEFKLYVSMYMAKHSEMKISDIAKKFNVNVTSVRQWKTYKDQGILEAGKLYLYAMRQIYIEKMSLLYEYNEVAYNLHSIDLTQVKQSNASLPPDKAMLNLVKKKERISALYDALYDVYHEFDLILGRLPIRYQMAVEVYTQHVSKNASFKEIATQANKVFHIKKDAYKQNFDEAVIMLANYVDYQRPPNLAAIKEETLKQLEEG